MKQFLDRELHKLMLRSNYFPMIFNRFRDDKLNMWRDGLIYKGIRDSTPHHDINKTNEGLDVN